MLNLISILTHAQTGAITSAKPILRKNRMDLYKIGGGCTVFCNPPYGRQIGKWVRKSYEESKKPDTVVVMLIPARTDTKYFHDYIYGKAEIRFIRGRLKFGQSKNPAPFPSMVVVYRGNSRC